MDITSLMLQRCRLLRSVALVGFSIIAMDASAQQITPKASIAPKGFQFHRDIEDRVVGVYYYGPEGLRTAGLEMLSHLRCVTISCGAQLTRDDLVYLSTLTNISELVIGQETIDPPVTIEGDLSGLQALKELEFVHLCKHDIKDDDLKFVASLPKITHLWFNSDGDLADRYFSVSDRCGDYVGKAAGLKSVFIQGSGKLTDKFVSKLTTGAPGLEHLNMGSPELTDESLHLLATNCRQIKWLDLHSNHFTDQGVKHLSAASTLEMLWLSSNVLTSDCVQSVRELRLLKHLELTVPTVSDDGVQILASLPNLEILALRQPLLSDKQFAIFRDHATITSAFINGAMLTDAEVLKTIAMIPKLNHLDVGAANKTLQAVVNRELSKRKSVR